MAPVAVALIARQMFNATMGPLNKFMSALGFPNIPFLTTTERALGAIIALEVRQQTPFVILVMRAAAEVPIFGAVGAVVDRMEGGPVRIRAFDRFAFCEEGARAFAVVLASDPDPYGCFILRKGVI